MSRKPECPWCGETTGAAYKRMQDAAVRITTQELESIKDHDYETKPLDWHGKIQLAAMSQGNNVLDSGGHPWIEGGGTCSRYTTLHLFAQGFIEVKPQNFTDGTVGRAWKITKAGVSALYKLMGAPHTAYPKDKPNDN